MVKCVRCLHKNNINVNIENNSEISEHQPFQNSYENYSKARFQSNRHVDLGNN